jgi:hypothetical protein
MNANPFWQSDTYAVIKAMKATGNRAGVIAQWKDFVEQWAIIHSALPEAAAIRAWLPHWQVRPFYTASELAPIFPALLVALGFTAKMPPKKSPARLSYELQYGGLPFRTLDGYTFFVVERVHFWRDASDAAWRGEIFHTPTVSPEKEI